MLVGYGLGWVRLPGVMSGDRVDREATKCRHYVCEDETCGAMAEPENGDRLAPDEFVHSSGRGQVQSLAQLLLCEQAGFVAVLRRQ